MFLTNDFTCLKLVQNVYLDGAIIKPVDDGDLTGRHAGVQERLRQGVLHDRRHRAPQRPRTIRLSRHIGCQHGQETCTVSTGMDTRWRHSLPSMIVQGQNRHKTAYGREPVVDLTVCAGV